MLDLQQIWREAVVAARGGNPAMVVIGARALTAARGFLSRLFRQVAPGRALTDLDCALIRIELRETFARALASETGRFAVGLEMVCTNPDRYQGGAQVRARSGGMQAANTVPRDQERWGKGGM